MKRQFLIFLALCVSGMVFSQVSDIFTWADGRIFRKMEYLPLLKMQGSESNILAHTSVYTYKELPVKSKNGKNAYILKLMRCGGCEGQNIEDTYYDYFSLWHNGKRIFNLVPMDPMCTVDGITTDQNCDYYYQVHLDDDSFALFLGGLVYGYDEAPQMLIILCHNGQADLVYYDYSYTYKFTPGEDFSIECVSNCDWMEDCDYSAGFARPHDSVLKTLSKHKIWKEGNMLKYKSWK
ncbi:MAG: hypothetical protein NC206_07460 [Bacteroides sp.]|nr:hypothetical protein [Roseburia sp.]MCM1346909.1 hypothetical protein [Bacteroides sp.]MCM1421441.1 hypothetical protein [Bacteroides sp.]